MVVFRCGVTVLFGLNTAKEMETSERLAGFVLGKFTSPESEMAEMLLAPVARDHINARGAGWNGMA